MDSSSRDFTPDELSTWFARLGGLRGSNVASAPDPSRLTFLAGADGLAKLSAISRIADYSAVPAGRFRAVALDCRLGSIALFARLQTDVTATRTVQNIDRDGRASIVIGSQRRGTVQLRQGPGSRTPVGDRRVSFVLTTQPFVVDYAGVNEPSGIAVPLDLLGIAERDLLAAIGQPLPDTALTRAAMTYIDAFIYEACALSGAVVGPDAELALVDLVRSLVSQVSRRTRPLEDRSVVVRAAVHDLIDRHHRRPDLTIDAIARLLNLSRRQLYRYFSDAEGGIAGLVADRRIETARQLLRTRTDLSVYDISMIAGFTNSNTFRAHFLRRHGVTPSDYRDAAIAGLTVARSA
ncbi:helix-turn-helix transcriptional regulator [Agromyces atrinae]|uniref:helix-turn-helix transcriptional regulator n=1 Tax=Agromyces atrinae TaxID=592376 RepID=UPI001F5665AD|nr:AraC family transcriptional regulator [Agromyces atrinae]MCI2957570.1 helix-turn-helix transcriptional regulator [Agromyces atrinae]